MPPETLDDQSDDSDLNADEQNEDLEFQCKEDDKSPQLFTQSVLNDLVTDLTLPKESIVLLVSKLKEKILLAARKSVYLYRNREKEFSPHFSQEGNLVYCSDITKLIIKFGIKCKVDDWRLFVHSSKRSLKAVLLHNGNQYASVPVSHSVHLRESYENLELVLEKIKYKDHCWMLCGDLKVLSMLLG